MFTGFAEFWLFGRECPVLSALLIDVVSFGIVVFARFRLLEVLLLMRFPIDLLLLLL